jgi:hypothetical protein
MTNRCVTARPVVGIFFPLRPTLGLDGHGYSPSVLKQIVFAGGSHPSFALAATMLDHLADVKISARQVGRITEEIGAEMTRQRDLQTARFQDKTLPAAVAGSPSLAVVWKSTVAAFRPATPPLAPAPARTASAGRKTRSRAW